MLTAAGLVEKLAALVPPPRCNVVRYHGTFAPAAKMRRHVVPLTHDERDAIKALLPICQVKTRRRPDRRYRLDWAALLKHVFGTDVLVCARCGGKQKVIASIEDEPTVQRILRHLDLPAEEPTCAPARDPPQLELSWEAA